MSALSHDIFSNIPEKDYLSLLEKGEARASKGEMMDNERSVSTYERLS